MTRANWIPAPAFYELNMACQSVVAAFGNVYLVGSANEKRDYRDVDLRTILEDDDFDTLFPNTKKSSIAHLDARWSLVCAAISQHMSRQSGLPVDFQIQRMTQANDEYPNQRRNALGLFWCGDSQRPEGEGRG